MWGVDQKRVIGLRNAPGVVAEATIVVASAKKDFGRHPTGEYSNWSLATANDADGVGGAGLREAHSATTSCVTTLYVVLLRHGTETQQ